MGDLRLVLSKPLKGEEIIDAFKRTATSLNLGFVEKRHSYRKDSPKTYFVTIPLVFSKGKNGPFKRAIETIVILDVDSEKEVREFVLPVTCRYKTTFLGYLWYTVSFCIPTIGFFTWIFLEEEPFLEFEKGKCQKNIPLLSSFLDQVFDKLRITLSLEIR